MEFKWGISTAAYQSEGGWDADDKGLSIWDVFTNAKRKSLKSQDGKTSCDFYHRYPHDLGIVKSLNIPNFRFSLSWSRIIPNGTGTINQKGVDFYNRVIDNCLELGITPWLTLYHWDLPWELERKGGWTNREMMNWFGEYVATCHRHFGDRVHHWIILNEPMTFTGAGHFLGVHAPGRRGLRSFLAAAHHAALCQAEGGRILRSLSGNSHIGTTFSSTYVEPFTNLRRDQMATLRADALLNRMFIEPLAGLGYPYKDFKVLERMESVMKDGDENRLAFDMDFVGLQLYARELITASLLIPYIWAKFVPADKRGVERTEMNWEVYPESIYHMLVRFSQYKSFKEIIVTENGAAFPDIITDGKINDVRRIDYIQRYVDQIFRAREAGVNVTGYFIWSLTDNFEWAEGYQPKYGLVHVDFKTQQRIIKESGYWYSRLIRELS